MPLFHFSARRELGGRWALEGEFDAFPAPGGGGLFDGIGRVRYQLTPDVSMAAGIRHLEGGAVDREFYNYVRLTAASLSVRVGF